VCRDKDGNIFVGQKNYHTYTFFTIFVPPSTIFNPQIQFFAREDATLQEARKRCRAGPFEISKKDGLPLHAQQR
jgi:hypothetical protein